MLLFSDISFWLVFVLFLAIYAIVRNYFRLGMLLYVVSFSLFFYWMANGYLMLLLPAVACFTWWSGRYLSATSMNGEKGWSPCARKWGLAVSIIVILFPLLYFKYTNFFLSTLNGLLASNFELKSIVLPVGISFFTFQAISYLVDVYKGKFKMQVSFLEFLFYLSFFPLLLAGPITRAETLLPQVHRQGKVSERCLYLGLWLVMLGLLKKCVIADYIAQYNDWIFADTLTYSGFECMMGILGYTIQIYCDFSGYSDMSIGIAAMMGFRLRENFSFPYAARNVSDFWRRWHISLSTWFRDYLYIPMGGNRKGVFRTYVNNIVTMLVAGLWHGSTWMFILWGGIHGFGLVVNKAFKPWLCLLPWNRWVTAVSVCLTFVYVAIAWVFFRAESVSGACQILTRSVTDFDIAYLVPFINARPWWCLFVVLPLLAQGLGRRGSRYLQLRFICLPWAVKLLLFFLVILIMLQFKTSNVQLFIYTQF